MNVHNFQEFWGMVSRSTSRCHRSEGVKFQTKGIENLFGDSIAGISKTQGKIRMHGYGICAEFLKG